jgi:splicing factor U2AF subunit
MVFTDLSFLFIIKGYAFCEYADISVTDLACQGLNNMELGEKKLIVQRASVGAKNAGMGGLSGTGSNSVAIETRSMMADIPFTGANDEDATRVLQLLNMVVPEELEDEEEYQGRRKNSDHGDPRN